MSTTPVTPGQRDLLELLHCYRYLTTSEIWELAIIPRSKRATEQMLARLRSAGLVAACPLHPERGAASAYAWRLLPRGAATIGAHAPRPAPLPVTATPNQLVVLNLLAKMKQLTTAQIWQHLHGDHAKSYTSHLLARLRKRGFIAGADLHPALGPSSEHYWMLRPRGCTALNIPYDTRYARRPGSDLIEHRGAQLAIQRQVAMAGWELLEPVVYNTARRRPAETAQSRQLVATVLAIERETLTTLLAQGVPGANLQDRIARWQAGHVGAVVPQFVNDYVAYQPDRPQRAAVFILHPLQAGPSFWTRRARTTAAQRRLLDRSGRVPRVEQYRRLAQVLPVVALFVSRETGYHYAPLLEKAGLRWVAVEDLAAKWDQITAPPPRH